MRRGTWLLWGLVVLAGTFTGPIASNVLNNNGAGGSASGGAENYGGYGTGNGLSLMGSTIAADIRGNSAKW